MLKQGFGDRMFFPTSTSSDQGTDAGFRQPFQQWLNSASVPSKYVDYRNLSSEIHSYQVGLFVFELGQSLFLTKRFLCQMFNHLLSPLCRVHLKWIKSCRWTPSDANFFGQFHRRHSKTLKWTPTCSLSSMTSFWSCATSFSSLSLSFVNDTTSDFSVSNCLAIRCDSCFS